MEQHNIRIFRRESDEITAFEFEISAPQCPTHYSPAGNSEVLDIDVYTNVRLSEIIISDILDSDHLPIVFHLLDHVTIGNFSDMVDKSTDWEQFLNLVSEITLLRIQNNLGEEADEAVRDFAAPVASAYRLPKNKLTFKQNK
jgi:hypothetical protein